MLLTRNNFSRHVTFMHTFVSKHRLTYDITDSVNVRNIGTHLLINIDEATLVNIDARFLSVDQLTVWYTTDSNKNCIVTYRLSRCFLAFHCYVDTVFFCFNCCYFSFKHQVEFLLDTLSKYFNDIFIGSWDHLIEHFNNVDLRT